MNETNVLEFYHKAKNHVVTNGYKEEVEWCEKREHFEKCTSETFFFEYVYVVLNAGMKEQVARKIYEKFCKDLNPEVIGHVGKRKAIDKAIGKYQSWFNDMQILTPESLQKAQELSVIEIKTKSTVSVDIAKAGRKLKEFHSLSIDELRIEYLKTLPWIGDITKYHLARNIGIDCVKPDRHLVRLADQFNFDTPLDMCLEVQKVTKERLGVIDVVLWRYCNLNGSKISQPLS